MRLRGEGVSLCCMGEGEEADVEKVKCETDLIAISHGVTRRLRAVPVTLDLQAVILADLLRFSQRSREGHLARFFSCLSFFFLIRESLYISARKTATVRKIVKITKQKGILQLQSIEVNYSHASLAEGL